MFLRKKTAPPNGPVRDLIFDIGLHKGLDANFYLRKGFKVVGLEAVPGLCAVSAETNADYVNEGKLKIINKALYYNSGEHVDFYVNPEKDDWGSLFKVGAEKGVGASYQISVETIALQDIVDEHGVPYYIKCDIEGGDAIFCEQLHVLKTQPCFVSVEATRLDDLAYLRGCGFNRFQIVNQYNNPWTKPPVPPREGALVEVGFSHEMSGLFGRELDPLRWLSFEDALRQFNSWHALQRQNPSIMIGWLDVHASTEKTLNAT